MEVTRGINFTCKSKEFEITIKDGIMKYQPEGSNGYENRVSPITDIKHKVFPIKRLLKTKYFQSVPMSIIELEENVYYVVNRIMRATK